MSTSRMYSHKRLRQLFLLAWMCLLSAKALSTGETSVTLRHTYSGHVDYVAVGTSFRDQSTATDPQGCHFYAPGGDGKIARSVTVNIPAGSTILDAFLYFAASGDAATYLGNDMSLNGVPISQSGGATADSKDYNFPTVTATSANNVTFYGIRRDVSGIVTGPGIYTMKISSADYQDVNNDGRVDNQTCLAAFALDVVYKDPNETNINVVNIFDGFRDYQNSSFQLTPRNFVIATSSVGKLTHITYEGDASIDGTTGAPGAKEEFSFEAPVGTTPVDQHNALNPPNNQYNSTVTGPDVYDTDTTWGLDVDTYDITSELSLAAGNYEVNTHYDTAQDLVILTAETILVRNKPLADVEVTLSGVGNFTQNGTGQYQVSVRNNGDGTAQGGYATGYIYLYMDLNETGAPLTLSALPTGTNWDCTASAAGTAKVRCVFDIARLTDGALDGGEVLPAISIPVNITGTPTSVVTRARVTNCATAPDANVDTDPCATFDGKHTNATQFDNVNFFDAPNTIFNVNQKSSTNNNVDQNTQPVLVPGQSDLSTSTKAWVDTNGGQVEPSDPIRFTIKVINTTSAAESGTLSISDTLPSGLDSSSPPTVVSNSCGGTTNWSSPTLSLSGG
ncbi:MAG TPA: hypothetical protein VJ998_02125, partial [Pseudomonadales bacterium]|nr:hypothetical protein [Pseudomonadales bacterium]